MLMEKAVRVLFVSGKLQEGIDTIRERLQGKTTVVAGPKWRWQVHDH